MEQKQQYKKIPAQIFNPLMEYLGFRPHKEVAELIAALEQTPVIEDEEKKDAKEEAPKAAE